MKITWGTKLVLFMAMFMGFIVVLTVKMMREDVSLIETDYYEKGENYQNTIDENKGVDSLIKVLIIQKNNQPVLAINNLKNTTISNASLNLVYLANKAKDKTLTIQINDSIPTEINLANYEKGNWISRLNWSDSYGKHYLEKNFKLQ